MKSYVWLFTGGLLALTACSETGWVKPGVTDEEIMADTEACLEIARLQAGQDVELAKFRTAYYGYDRYNWQLRDIPPSYPALEFRYRQLCMLSRGYELAPLDEQPSG